MTLRTKSSLLLLMAYLGLLGGLAWSLHRWLAVFDAKVTGDTLELIARETTAQLAERAIAALQTENPGARQLVRDRIEDVVLLSGILASVAVVDNEGRVVASDGTSEAPRLRPGEVFGERHQARVESLPRPFFHGGAYLAYYPLVSQGVLLGYLELAFQDEEIAALYDDARARLLFAAVAGPAVVLVLGGLLQARLSRRARAIARTLEDPTYVPGTGPGVPPDDEFAEPLAAARRVRTALTLLRTIAHELKAPLSAMTIHVDLLRESLRGSGTRDDVAEAQHRYTAVLGQELERLNRALADLLSQTLPANGAPEGFDLRGVTSEVGTLLGPQARRQQVRLTTQVPTEPVLLVGYRDRLKQAVLNVAVNALEAMRDGGHLDLGLHADHRAARIDVADTGPGMSQEVLSRIYERGYSTKGSGGGIGLYVSRALVQLHGGQIRVHSRPGAGTRVEIELPVTAGC